VVNILFQLQVRMVSDKKDTDLVQNIPHDFHVHFVKIFATDALTEIWSQGSVDEYQLVQLPAQRRTGEEISSESSVVCSAHRMLLATARVAIESNIPRG